MKRSIIAALLVSALSLPVYGEVSAFPLQVTGVDTTATKAVSISTPKHGFIRGVSVKLSNTDGSSTTGGVTFALATVGTGGVAFARSLIDSRVITANTDFPVYAAPVDTANSTISGTAVPIPLAGEPVRLEANLGINQTNATVDYTLKAWIYIEE